MDVNEGLAEGQARTEAGAWFGTTPRASLCDLVVSESRGEAPAEGERRLLTAVLEDALRVYQKYAFSGTRRGRRLFREAETWFTHPDLDVACPFPYVCDVLGIDPDWIRNTLAAWRARHYTGATVSARAPRPYDRGPLDDQRSRAAATGTTGGSDAGHTARPRAAVA
jgi:hypothetical protein